MDAACHYDRVPTCHQCLRRRSPRTCGCGGDDACSSSSSFELGYDDLLLRTTRRLAIQSLKDANFSCLFTFVVYDRDLQRQLGRLSAVEFRKV